MEKLIVLFFSLAFSAISAQSYEVGLFAGGANMISDVGKTNYVLPTDMAIGGIFKWNRAKRYAWRASVIYAKITADDTKSDLSSRQERGYIANNSILEASAGLEFNFVDYNLHQLGPRIYTLLIYRSYLL